MLLFSFVREQFAKSSVIVRQMMYSYLFENGGFEWFSRDPCGIRIIEVFVHFVLPSVSKLGLEKKIS